MVFVGNHPTCDAGWDEVPRRPSDGKEAIDRKAIDLPQEELVQQVLRRQSEDRGGAGVQLPVCHQLEPAARARHPAHHPHAQEEGTAIAEVLFGDYNPGGRLVQTWPKSLDQLPPMMDYDIRHGRTYMYFKGEPLYPFGYGLSYTTFKYSNLRTSAAKLSAKAASPSAWTSRTRASGMATKSCSST